MESIFLKYENFIQDNITLLNHQKNDILVNKRNIFYVGPESDAQIITYINQCKKNNNMRALEYLKILFSYFINFKLIDELKMTSDTEIYNYIWNNFNKYEDDIFPNAFKKIKLFFDLEMDVSLRIAPYVTNSWQTQRVRYFDYDNSEYGEKFAETMKITISNNAPYNIITIFNIEKYDIGKLLEEIKKIIKPGGYLIIFAINIVDDFGVMIEDIYRKITKHDCESHFTYYHYLEYEFILRENSFEKKLMSPIYHTHYFSAEYNHPIWMIFRYMY
jgi:hypothetical protein